MKILLPIILILLASNQIFPQSLSVFNVDQTAFPIVKADYFLFDINGKAVLNQGTKNFKITEDGILRNVISINCPSIKEPDAVSVAMSIDISSSMIDSSIGILPFELGKITAKEICSRIPMPPSEFALQVCNDKAVIIKDFTKNLNLILNALDTIVAGGNNNFGEQLLNPLTGLLNIAKSGKNKRVAIIYTDAWWKALSVGELKQCADTCAKYGIQLFAVIYSRPEVEPNGIKKSLETICNATGGYFYDGITEKQAASDIASRIQAMSQNEEPCTIEWESSLKCQPGATNVDVRNKIFNIKSDFTYENRGGDLVKIDIFPTGINFINVPLGTKKDTTIKITALNQDVKVLKIISSNSKFTVNPDTFDLKIGESKLITVSYTAVDSSYEFARFDLETDLCQNQFYVVSNYPGRSNFKSALKLTHPNGGEIFSIGSDTTISWEGVLPEDTVKLEYSTNNGKFWNLISTKASGLEYIWKNIPNTPSLNCLVRVSDAGSSDSTGSLYKIQWQKCFGGSSTDNANDIIQTNDDGFFVVGFTFSKDGDVKFNNGQADVWAVKLGKAGGIEWQKSYGGSGNDYGVSASATLDGGYIIGCTTNSNDLNVTGYHGNTDYFITKISVKGNIVWEKCIGGTGQDYLKSIKQTSDGGYIIGGFSNSGDGDFPENKGMNDFWITKLSSTGSLEFSTSVGSSASDQCYSIEETNDGGFIAAGSSNGNDGDVTGNLGDYDYWIVKFDNRGKIIWQRSLGGQKSDNCYNITNSADGGFIAVGKTLSNDGMVTGKLSSSLEDGWVTKLDVHGYPEWQKCVGGSGSDYLYGVDKTQDGYIIAGMTNSKELNSNGTDGSNALACELDAKGNILWQKSYGGSSVDQFNAVKSTADGGVIFAGYSNSNDGDIKGNHGASDFWVVKMNGLDSNRQDISDSVFAIIAPIVEASEIDMQKCLVGKSKDSVIIDFIKNTGRFPCFIDSIYFSGDDAGAFELISGVPPYKIEPANAQHIEITFKPGKIGLHSAIINIITLSDTLRYKIIGTGVKSDLQLSASLIDFGIHEIGTTKDTTIFLIKNISENPITITNTVLNNSNSNQFQIISGGGGFTLAPNETRELKLRFAPVVIGRTNSGIAFDYEGFGSPAVAELFGQGIGGYVYINDDSAFAGDRISIPVHIGDVNFSNLKQVAAKFDAKIKFQNSILSCDDPNQIIKISSDSTLIKISGELNKNSDILTYLNLTAGLGSVLSTSIDIVDFTWYDANNNPIDYDTDTKSGNFKLLGICPEGGRRLVNPNEKISMSVQPNPPDGLIFVNLKLSEFGHTSLILTDISGKLIKTIFETDNINFVRNTIKFAINDLNSGEYFLVLKTPSFITSKKIIINK